MEVTEVKPDGKRAMDARSFAAGVPALWGEEGTDCPVHNDHRSHNQRRSYDRASQGDRNAQGGARQNRGPRPGGKSGDFREGGKPGGFREDSKPGGRPQG